MFDRLKTIAGHVRSAQPMVERCSRSLKPFSHPCGQAAHQGDDERLFLGGHSPPRPSQRVRGWGKRVAPLPASPRWGEEPDALPQRGRVREEVVFVGGHSPPRPSHRVRGWGNPVSPSPCSKKSSSGEGCALSDPPVGGGVGKPGFPTPLSEGPCSR